jgi:hypothetical protein
MSSTHHTYFRFAISEDVLSLRDLASCLGISKKDIHSMRLTDIGEDGWNTYEFDLNCELKAEKVNEEFGETFLLKNVYLNGTPLEDYEYDDTKSTADTVDSDVLTDTDSEDEEDDDDEDDDDEEDTDDEDDDNDEEEEEESEHDTSYSSSDSDDSGESGQSTDSGDSGDSGTTPKSKETIDKTPEEIYASIKKKFPFLSEESAAGAYKTLTEILDPLIKAEQIVIGNTTTGESNVCTGYFLTKDGEIFLYTY